MRILHINNVANVAATMVEGLSRLGHAADLRPLRLVAGRRSTAVKLLALPLRLWEMGQVNREVRAGRYDVVHIHFAYLGWLGILGRYPYFLHCHGSDVRQGLRDPLRRRPIIASLQRARAVFFVTPDLGPIVRAVRPEAMFLPNPVDTTRFAAPAGGQGRPPRLLIISELSPIKGVEVAFAAVQQLRARHAEVQVTAIDRGVERQRLYGIPGVTFVAPVPHQDMPALIQAHDIVVGQFGLGILSMAELESMACGKPVVCYFKYGDWYPEPPPVLSTDQPAQAVEYLSSLIEDPLERRDRGERCRAWVQRYHDYVSVARRLEQIYLGYLSGSG